MTANPASGRSAEEVLDLLKNAGFCADVKRTIAKAAGIAEQVRSLKVAAAQLDELEQEFKQRWGVSPPTTSELVDPDPRWDPVDAIGSGR